MKKNAIFLPLLTMALLTSCANKPRHYLENYDAIKVYQNDVLMGEGVYQYNKKHLLTSSVLTAISGTKIVTSMSYNDYSDVTKIVTKENDSERVNLDYTYTYNKRKQLTKYTVKGFDQEGVYNYQETYEYDKSKRLTKTEIYQYDESSSKYLLAQEVHYLYLGKAKDYIEKDTYRVEDSILLLNDKEINTFNNKNLLNKKRIVEYNERGMTENDVTYGYIYDDYDCLVAKGIVVVNESTGEETIKKTYRAEYLNHIKDKPTYIFSYDDEESDVMVEKFTYDKYKRISSYTNYNIASEIRVVYEYTSLVWE